MRKTFPRRWGLALLSVGLVACGGGDSHRDLLRVGAPCDSGSCPDATALDASSDAESRAYDSSSFGHPDGHFMSVDAAPPTDARSELTDARSAPTDATSEPVEAAPPRCGDGKIDPGEQCDDGNRDAGDRCRNDCTKADCVHDRDCDDGLFCDGVETCREGHCAPGLPVSTDDKVACTTDSCDEGSHAVRHAPDDGACKSLDEPPICSTAGALAGKIVEQKGACDATAGCHQVASVVDDCLDDTLHPTTYSCSTSGPVDVLEHEGTCTAGGTVCSSTSTVANACGNNLPPPVCLGSAAANDLIYHFGATATCSGGASPVCGSTDSTKLCTPGNPACTAGKLTTFTPTCTAAGGCSKIAKTPVSCPDPADTCTPSAAGLPALTTYAPACASATACGTPTSTRTSCKAAAPICVAGGAPTKRTYSPACNAAGTACANPGTATDAVCANGAVTCANAALTTHPANCTGAGVCGTTTVTTPCSDPPSTCTTPAGAPPVLTTYTPGCKGSACSAVATTTSCAPTTAPSCSRTRVYTAWVGTCDATKETCGQRAVTTNCAALGSRSCKGITQVTVTGLCSAANGCSTTTTTHDCNQAYCADTDTAALETGCAGGVCAVTLTPCNGVGCNSQNGQCNIIP